MKCEGPYCLLNLYTFCISENVTEELHPEESTVTEYRSGFSVALHLLLPVAGLIFVLFHQTNLLNKILLQIDRNCVSGKFSYQHVDIS